MCSSASYGFSRRPKNPLPENLAKSFLLADMLILLHERAFFAIVRIHDVTRAESEMLSFPGLQSRIG